MSRWLPRDPVLRAALVAFLILAVSFTVFFSYVYIKYDRVIEKRFRTPVFANSAKIYALPKTVKDGEKIEPREIPHTEDVTGRVDTSRLSAAAAANHRDRNPEPPNDDNPPQPAAPIVRRLVTRAPKEPP